MLLRTNKVYYQVYGRQTRHILLGEIFPDSSCGTPDVLEPVAHRLVGARHASDGCMTVQHGLVVVRHCSPHVVNPTHNPVWPLTLLPENSVDWAGVP